MPKFKKSTGYSSTMMKKIAKTGKTPFKMKSSPTKSVIFGAGADLGIMPTGGKENPRYGNWESEYTDLYEEDYWKGVDKHERQVLENTRYLDMDIGGGSADWGRGTPMNYKSKKKKKI